MSFFGRLPKLLIIFWLIQVGITSLLWSVLPTYLGDYLLLSLVVVNAGLLYGRQFELPVLTNVVLTLALAHLWRGGGFSTPLLVSALIFTSVALTGLIVQSTGGKVEHDDLLAWFLIGLFTAESSTLMDFWPITYLQKSVICTAVFYLLWRLWTVVDGERRQMIGHFAFVLLAVMVVITNIIWTTWPGLKTF